MKKLILLVLAVLLAGCGSLAQTLQGEGSLGTHKYTVAPDGTVNVDVHSVYGGPGLEVTNEEGKVTTRILPADRIKIDLIKALIP